MVGFKPRLSSIRGDHLATLANFAISTICFKYYFFSSLIDETFRLAKVILKQGLWGLTKMVVYQLKLGHPSWLLFTVIGHPQLYTAKPLSCFVLRVHWGLRTNERNKNVFEWNSFSRLQRLCFLALLWPVIKCSQCLWVLDKGCSSRYRTNKSFLLVFCILAWKERR